MKQFYKPKDLIKLLGFSKNTIYKYLEEGQIKSTRVGKKGGFRIPLEEVERLVEVHGKDTKVESDDGKVVVHEQHIKPEESSKESPALSLLERIRVEAVPALSSDHTPNLFDWFVGLLGIAIGFSLFLFPAFVYNQGFSSVLYHLMWLRVVLLVGGLLFLMSDLMELKSEVWHKFMHVVLGISFLGLAIVMAMGGEGRGIVIYGALGLVMLLTLIAKKVLPVWRFIWLVFLVSVGGAVMAVIWPGLYMVDIVETSFLGMTVFVWLLIPTVILAASLWSVKRKNAWYQWLSIVNGLIFLGFSFVNVLSSNWDRAVAYILLGVFSFLFPFWERFRIERKKDARKRLFSFGYVGVVVVVGLLLTRVVQTRFKDFTAAILERQAAEVSSRVEMFLTQASQEVETLAQSKLMQESLANGEVETLKILSQDGFRSSGELKRLMVFDTEGVMKSFYPHASEEIVGNSTVYREYFESVRENGTIFSDLFREETAEDFWVVAVSTPVFDGDGEFLGVVAGSLDLTRLQDSLEGMIISERGYVAVIDGNRRAVVHPGSEERFGILGDEYEIDSNRVVKEHFDEVGERYGEELMLAAFEDVDDFGWTVVVEEPLRDIGKVVSGLSLFIFLLILAASVFLMWGLAVDSKWPKRLEKSMSSAYRKNLVKKGRKLGKIGKNWDKK